MVPVCEGVFGEVMEGRKSLKGDHMQPHLRVYADVLVVVWWGCKGFGDTESIICGSEVKL